MANPMRLARTARARRAIGLTSLIDVVFLLLVFFMLSSTFLKFGTVKINTAGASDGQGTADLSKMVLVHIAKDRGVRVNGAVTEADQLGSILTELIENGAEHAIVVATESATVDDLIATLTQVRRSPFQSVRIVD
ncbi:MAG: biopolymer transporter ExbD [Pseudomonadota bacterium]